MNLELQFSLSRESVTPVPTNHDDQYSSLLSEMKLNESGPGFLVSMVLEQFYLHRNPTY